MLSTTSLRGGSEAILSLVVSCPADTRTKSMQLFQDRIGSSGPLEGLTIRVVCRHKMVDALHELFDASERATTDSLVGDQREEAFNLVQPGAVSWDEVHVQRGRVDSHALIFGWLWVA